MFSQIFSNFEMFCGAFRSRNDLIMQKPLFEVKLKIYYLPNQRLFCERPQAIPGEKLDYLRGLEKSIKTERSPVPPGEMTDLYFAYVQKVVRTFRLAK